MIGSLHRVFYFEIYRIPDTVPASDFLSCSISVQFDAPSVKDSISSIVRILDVTHPVEFPRLGITSSCGRKLFSILRTLSAQHQTVKATSW